VMEGLFPILAKYAEQQKVKVTMRITANR